MCLYKMLALEEETLRGERENCEVPGGESERARKSCRETVTFLEV